MILIIIIVFIKGFIYAEA